MAIGNNLDEKSSAPQHWIAVAHHGQRSGVRPKLSIVIPALNEQYRLPVVIEALRVSVEADNTEVIVVDDGSTDDTNVVAKAALDWSPLARVIRHEKNLGKGAAVRTGVAAATGEIIGFLDADNATSLDTVNEMLPLVHQPLGRVGAAFGSRHAQGAVVTGSPLIRGLMGRVFNHLVKIAAGTQIGDTQCGAKVFSSSAARLAFYGSTVDGFAFDVEILRRLIDLGFEVIEHPVDWHHVPGTKVQMLTPLHMFIDIARLRFSPPKLRYPARSMVWTAELRNNCDLIRGDVREGDSGWVIDIAEDDISRDPIFLDSPKEIKTWQQLLETRPETRK